MKNSVENKFIIGCNYWASNAGTEMWRDWEEDIVRKDIKTLSENGVEYMRVFPNWRDFQPIYPLVVAGSDDIVNFVTDRGRPFTNKYFLDEKMLERFGIMCDICKEYNVKLIVGLITGFMSGRTFTPPALFGKNLIRDPLALCVQQRFIEGFVKEFRDRDVIYAWDLGNECNNLSFAENRMAANHWTLTISNAIRAFDQTRPIVSGMHSILPDDNDVRWSIGGQADGCDILTTHPYPYWVDYAYMDKNISLRTLMHATCQTKFYSEVGGKPCLVEELGTMGPMLCDDENSADFMRLNLLSNWINGAEGVMWWCANDQTNLVTEPYISNMCEVELGMMDVNLNPKPILKETKRISDIIKSFDFEMPKAEVDAVCVLTRGYDQWGVAYMTYILAKQAGLNISFCYADNGIPDAKCYIVPSVSGPNVMLRDRYLELKQRVKEGAKLYLSVDDGIIAEFEEFTGLHISDSCNCDYHGEICLEDNGSSTNIPYERKRFYDISPVTAKILASDKDGHPILSENSYGKGKVYFANFPLEKNLLDKFDAFADNCHLIYKKIFKDCIDEHIVTSDNENTCVTIHKDGDTVYGAIVNYSEKEQKNDLKIKKGYKVDKVIYGNVDTIPKLDATIIKLIKE